MQYNEGVKEKITGERHLTAQMSLLDVACQKKQIYML